MRLTPTQRDFLVAHLNVSPGRKRRNADEEATTADEGDDAPDLPRGVPAATALHDGPEVELVEDAPEVSEVRGFGGTGVLGQALGTLSEAFRDITGIKAREEAAALRVQANEPFFRALDAAEKALADLRKHPQHAHVDNEIKEAGAQLAEARKASKADNFVAAHAAVVLAETACADGKRFADLYAVFVSSKINAERIISAIKPMLTDATWQQLSQKIGDAVLLASYPTRSFTLAEAMLAGVATTAGGALKARYVTRAEVEIANLRAKAIALEAAPGVAAGASAVQPVLNAIDVLQAQVAADIAADRWGQAVLTARFKVAGLIATGLERARRREAYDIARAATIAKIDALKVHRSLLGQVFSMSKLVERADALATGEVLRMEDGKAALAQIDATCVELGMVAADVEAYLAARADADRQMVALKNSPTVSIVAAQVKSIDGLLAQARQTTGVVDAAQADTASLVMEDRQAYQQDWAGAHRLVTRALAEIADANALAASLADTASVLAGVDATSDLPKLVKAASDLRQQATTAKAEPYADRASDDFGQVFTLLDEADKQRTAKQIELAASTLQAAAEVLLKARTVQSEYARFTVEHTALDQRTQALVASKRPPASSIQPKIDALQALLETAAKAAAASDWDGARRALRSASTAADETELFSQFRRVYDARAEDLTQDAARLGGPLKKEVIDMIARAKAQADGFNLDLANRFLDNADARVASAQVTALASSNPDDPALMLAVDRMLAAEGGDELLGQPTDSAHTPLGKSRKVKSGPELLDALVKELPETVSPAVIMKLASKRFGVELFVSALYNDTGSRKEEVRSGPGDELYEETAPLARLTKRAKSGRQMYEMLALASEQAMNNPSLKRIERRHALKTKPDGSPASDIDAGGFYQAEGGVAVVNGRPDNTKQKFGKKLGDELPTVEKGFEPANEDAVDYFDFAVVHEVGHAVDDRLGFMASREGDAAFGGWKTYGGAIDDIVAAVAGFTGYDRAPEQSVYISDLMLGNKLVTPIAPDGEERAWEQARRKVHAWYDIVTNEQLWWSQTQSMQVSINGVVYQEAYKGKWVSYLASARTKGITGYQFRAPGEWFAELYASYQFGKLKPGHPARKWLSSLSL